MTFIDLFSGAGGMSFGFHSHPAFKLVAAFDGEFGKPSSGGGSLGCNDTYQLNMGLSPTRVDLSSVTDDYILDFRNRVLGGKRLDVLSACPPCTGFSRANPNNHINDDQRNSLVVKTADWIRILQPNVVVMENARELLKGNFSYHFDALRKLFANYGYSVHASIHMLSDFGLPQKRERALVVATRSPLEPISLEDLWSGHTLDSAATTVRRGISHLSPINAGETDPTDRFHTSPNMTHDSIQRLKSIPHNGGSWIDLAKTNNGAAFLTPAMQRYISSGDLGSHPDVYGRMAWDKPSVTIKRECAHIGNGRYAHPEQDRLCSVREMAILQGFPSHYQFGGQSLSNMYRHIGDAVPPMISFQLAHVVNWIMSGKQPLIDTCILPHSSLCSKDIKKNTIKRKQMALSI